MTAANVPHSREFFLQMLTCAPAYARLAQAIDAALGGAQGRTLLDIGCGVGLQSEELARLGWDVTGVDPLAPIELVRECNGFRFLPRDLLHNDYADMWNSFDVVLCTETAEHVYEERAPHLVEACATLAGDSIVWSSAAPGQHWEGHVTLKPHAWWLAMFADRGWCEDALRTGTLRQAMTRTGAQHAGAAANFRVLRRA